MTTATSDPRGLPLTLRELEVVELIAEGRSNEAIGAELGVASRTVKAHLLHAGSKAGTRDRAGILGHAILTGKVRIATGRPVPDGFDRDHFEVLVRIARGKSNATIADELGVTLDSAKYRVQKLLALFGVRSREEAVAAGFACGVLRAVPRQRVAP